MRLRVLPLIIGCVLLSACNGDATSPDVETPISTTTVVAEEARDASYPTPPPPPNEEHLEGELASIPEVYVVPGRQSIESLARYLKTDPSQLRRVNGPMDDILLPGTIVLVPNTFLPKQAAH